MRAKHHVMITDRFLPVRHPKPRPAMLGRIRARPANQRIRPSAANQRVVSIAPNQGVIATARINRVTAGRVIEVAIGIMDQLTRVGAGDAVAARGAQNGGGCLGNRTAAPR